MHFLSTIPGIYFLLDQIVVVVDGVIHCWKRCL